MLGLALVVERLGVGAAVIALRGNTLAVERATVFGFSSGDWRSRVAPQREAHRLRGRLQA
jgi:hypothetical protein